MVFFLFPTFLPYLPSSNACELALSLPLSVCGRREGQSPERKSQELVRASGGPESCDSRPLQDLSLGMCPLPSANMGAHSLAAAGCKGGAGEGWSPQRTSCLWELGLEGWRGLRVHSACV